MNAHARRSRKLAPTLDPLEEWQVLSHITHLPVHHAAHAVVKAAARHVATRAIATQAAAFHPAVASGTSFVVRATPAPAPTPTGNPFDHGSFTLADGEPVVLYSGVPFTTPATISSSPSGAADNSAVPTGTLVPSPPGSFMYGTQTLQDGEVVGFYSSSVVR